MTIKKSLENRIRGWFPQEPNLIRTQVKKEDKFEYETKKQPPVIPSGEINFSATKFAGATAIFLIFLYGFVFFTTLDLKKYPISAFQIAVLIIIGLVAGVIGGMIPTENLLRRFSKDYVISTTRKEIVLSLVSTIVFIILSSYYSWFVYGSKQLAVLQGFSFSLYAWVFPFTIMRPVLFYAFERREKMRIMQTWWGSVQYFLIPKAPPINISELKE
jgi:hypothetical protein